MMDTANIEIDESKKKQKSGKITPVDLARAVSAIIVFGMPLIAGTTAVIGYGIYKIYKRLKG
jgi:hypothetical protein